MHQKIIGDWNAIERERRQSALRQERELLSLRSGEGEPGDYTLPNGKWFAVRTAPNAQRAPSADLVMGRQTAASVVERNLKGEGFDFFMPSYRVMVRHHRSKRWIEKRFPTFVGYLFVDLSARSFQEVEAVDGVGKVMKARLSAEREPEPFEFPLATIDRLRWEEWEQQQAFIEAKALILRQEEAEKSLSPQQRRRRASHEIRSRNLQYHGLRSMLSRGVTSPATARFIHETMDKLVQMNSGT